MGFQVSPGVNITERDLTLIVPSVATTSAGIAGSFRWGPVAERVLVDSTNTLAKIFGQPNSDASIYTSFFTAANFLGYGNNLQVVRVVPDGALNAAVTTAKLVKNKVDFDGKTVSDLGNQSFIAKYPGELGNSLKVFAFDGTNAGVKEVHLIAAANKNQRHVYLGGINGASQDTVLLHNGDILRNTTDRREYLVVGFSGGASSSSFLQNFFSGEITLGTTLDGTNLGAVLLSPPLRDAYAGPSGAALGATFELLNRYSRDFASVPSTTAYIGARGGTGDAINIMVVDEDGVWTGEKGAVLEKFEGLSKSADGRKVGGGKNYYRDVINEQSQYLWSSDELDGVTSNLGESGTYNVTTESQITGFANGTIGLSLTGGTGGDKGTSGSNLYTDGYELFEDSETVDVSLILSGDAGADLSKSLVDLAERRKDCVVFLSPPVTDVEGKTPDVAVKNIVEYRNNDLNVSSSYAVLDGNLKYQVDPYNDVVRAIPFNGDIAGLVARTETVSDPWFSPAGFNRGQIRGVVKLSFQPNKTLRDELYKNGVNPIAAFPGEGTVLYGDKTLLSTPSAFDRISVRRLFIILEKAIASAAKFQLFEQNDSFTRAQFLNLVTPFLRRVQAGRGISNFRVVCDESNNTPDVVARNEFVADIFVQPVSSVNFISLNFVADKAGASFNETA